MPSLEDLKNNGNEERFIPHVVEEEEKEIVIDQRNLANSSNQINVPKKNVAMSMTTGEEREKADFSSLEKPETPGVEVRESIVADTFAPGGPFDEYLKNKRKEAMEDIASWEAEAEIEGKQVVTTDENGNIVVPSEDEELENNTPVIENTTYKNVDVFSDEESDEEDEEDMSEEKLVETNIEEENSQPDPEDIEVDEVEDVVEEDIDMSVTKVSEKFDDETDVIDEDEDVKDSDEEAEATFQSFKKMVTEKIKPVSKKLNISGFTIAKQPNMSNAVVATKELAIAKWVLPSTGITIMMKEFLGADLEKLRLLIQGNDARGTLQLIYDHIVSPKPQRFEAWLKTIAYDDYDHLFMAVYIASFSGANYMPVDCTNPSCKEKTYVTDDIPFTQLVKYKDDSAKKEFKKIYAEEPVLSNPIVATEIVPVSEKYAIGFMLPTIYSVLIESGYFDQEFTKKYATTISIAPYIETIYEINFATKTLIPIGYKEYVNNDGKTAKSKIVKYAKIINTLSSDEITTLRAYTEAINKNSDMITYQIPDTTCPHCGHQNAASASTAASMVFLRNQLALLVNT